MSSARALVPLLFATAIAALPPVAHGQIFRCETRDGVIEYSNSASSSADKTCKALDLPAVTIIPAPSLPPGAMVPGAAKGGPAPAGAAAGTAAGGAAGNAAAGPAFPRVDTAAQRSRDSDRRRILEDELRKEEARLAELRQEFNSGEPQRRGDERNFQKYLDRIQRLQDDIGRSESTVSALRRELASVRE
jgi:hypothetical protein